MKPELSFPGRWTARALAREGLRLTDAGWDLAADWFQNMSPSAESLNDLAIAIANDPETFETLDYVR